MKTTTCKADTVSLQDLDLAIDQALNRVAQARELHEDECADVSGGLPWQDIPFIGYIIKELFPS